MNQKLDLDLDLICELYKNGKSAPKIARELGVSGTAVRRRLHLLQDQGRLTIRPPGARKGQGALELDEDRILELYTTGKGIERVAVALGVSYDVARRRVHKLQSEGRLTVRAPGGWKGQNALEPNLVKAPQLVQVDALVLGDGHVGTYYVDFCSSTRALIDFVVRVWCGIGLHPSVRRHRGELSDCVVWYTRACSVKYAEHLQALSTDHQVLHEWVRGCEREFVAGLLDAEGCVNEQSNGAVHVTISDTNRALLALVQSCVSLPSKIHSPETLNTLTGEKYTCHRLRFNGGRRKVLEFLLTLPLIRLRPRVEELAAKYL